MVTFGKLVLYDELLEMMYALKQQYSELLQFRSVGRSFDGRNIPLLQLGFGEKALICTAGVHGRESINPVVMLKMIEVYCETYLTENNLEGFSVKELLDTYAICFLPLLNPDGYTIAIEGFEQIRNSSLQKRIREMKIPYAEWKYNGRGKDINRNFPSQSYLPQGQYDLPGSEIETKILMKVFADYPSVAYLDFHSRGKVIYYYRSAMSDEYNERQKLLAEEIQKLNNYELGSKEEELLTSDSGGNTVHYYSEHYGMPAITIETADDEATFPLIPKYQQETFEEICTIPLSVLRKIEQLH